MEIMTANQAKTHFGSALLKAQNQPIQISKNGKPVAVMISVDEYDNMENLKMRYLQQLVQQADADTKTNQLAEGANFFAELYSGIA